MSHIAIITDSSAYLPPALVAQYGIHTIPLYVHLDEQIFRDGVDLDTSAFYRKLNGAKTLPTTSQPSSGDFMALYRRLGHEVDAIISIHISGKLSGTVDSALAARHALQAEASERGDPPPVIHVMDSLLTAGGLGLLVTAAVRQAQTAPSADAVVHTIEALIPRLTVVFVVDTLEFLHKGGRIGGALSLLGSMIQIKPILYLDNGSIAVLEKVRTAQKAKLRLLKIMEEQMDRESPVHVAIMHADALYQAKKLEQDIAAHFDCAELFVCEFSPVIATHVGPGTVALAFYQ